MLSDDTDAAGGWATPYPYNQMLVTARPPLGEPGFGTTVHDDWLRLVITHEYTHVLQLDLASRLPLALRSVFGRLYFPNALQPEWLVEGLATYEETELTAGGRGRSPGAEMVLRMAALEGPFPTLEQMAVFPDRWPAGQVPYLFGESFLRHLAARSGREGVAGVSRVYGGHPLPFFVETTGLEALGAEYRDLWQEWSEALRARFREQERAVAARGVTRAAALTADGRFNVSPAWSPDGARIAWLRADGLDFPGVWVMNADGTGRRRLAKNAFSTATSGATLAWSPDGARLYYTKPGFVRGAALFNDLWACDAATGAETRLTRGLRARDPPPSPDGRALALVTSGGGMTRLALLDLEGPLPAATPSRLRYLTDRRSSSSPSRAGARTAAGSRSASARRRREARPRARSRRPDRRRDRPRPRPRRRPRVEPRRPAPLVQLGPHGDLQPLRLGPRDRRVVAGHERPRRRLLARALPRRPAPRLRRLLGERLRPRVMELAGDDVGPRLRSPLDPPFQRPAAPVARRCLPRALPRGLRPPWRG